MQTFQDDIMRIKMMVVELNTTMTARISELEKRVIELEKQLKK